MKAKLGVPGDEPDWESDPDFVIGRDGKTYRKVPTPESSEEEKRRFVDWQRAYLWPAAPKRW